MNETKMIAIISKNKGLARLCRIEADFCGLSSYVGDGTHTDLSKYSLAIIDIDTVAPSDVRGECMTVALTGGDVNSIGDNGFKYARVIKYPFLLSELRELLFRVRQSEAERMKDDITESRNMTIYADAVNKRIVFCGREMELSEYEFRVLERLCGTSGVAVGRDELSDILGADRGNIVEVYICHLRKKLEAISDQKIIHTVRSKGYITYWSMRYI